MEVTKTFYFEAAHRLLHHKGACSNLHGHSYKVDVTIKGGVKSPEGMVADFSQIKSIVNLLFECSLPNKNEAIAEPWDHAVILNSKDPLTEILRNQDVRLVVFDCESSAENMASIIASFVQEALTLEKLENLIVSEVKVWETKKNCAIWKVEGLDEV